MVYSHILAATDFSTTGNHAVQCAFEEATLHGARVTLLHVLHHQPDTRVYFLSGDPETRAGLRDSIVAFPLGYDPESGSRLPMANPHAPITVARDYDEEALEGLCELVPATFKGAWDAAVASGEPSHAILHVAQEHAADLIVIGSHGHTGLLRGWLGGVAEKVGRRAPCAVLTIKASPEAHAGKP